MAETAGYLSLSFLPFTFERTLTFRQGCCHQDKKLYFPLCTCLVHLYYTLHLSGHVTKFEPLRHRKCFVKLLESFPEEMGGPSFAPSSLLIPWRWSLDGFRQPSWAMRQHCKQDGAWTGINLCPWQLCGTTIVDLGCLSQDFLHGRGKWTSISFKVL